MVGQSAMYRDASSWTDAVLDEHEAQREMEEVTCWFEHSVGCRDDERFVSRILFLLVLARYAGDTPDIPF